MIQTVFILDKAINTGDAQALARLFNAGSCKKRLSSHIDYFEQLLLAVFKHLNAKIPASTLKMTLSAIFADSRQQIQVLDLTIEFGYYGGNEQKEEKK